MAGLPELQGVFGTFSGRRGLNLQPLEMKQRQQMFLQQLQQEQQRLAAQQAAQTRGLDLEQQRMDMGAKENELARAFQQNLMTQRNQFDSEQARLQREAADAAQMRAIQEQQRAQGAAQGFAREEGAAERGFRGQQAELDRGLQQQAMEVRKQEFEKSFGLESAKFDFMKDITLRDEGRKTRAEELNREMQDLQKQVIAGEINQRQAQTAMILKQTEAIGMELREALEDTGLSKDQYAVIAEKLAAGEELPGNVAASIMKSPKAAKAVANLMALMQGAQEMGLRTAQKEGIEAETGLNKLRSRAVQEELDAAADKTKEKPETPEDKALKKWLKPPEISAYKELQRKEKDGNLGEIGELRKGAYTKLVEIGDDDSEQAVLRAERIRSLLSKVEKYGDDEDVPGSLSPDAVDAILVGSVIGIPALVGRSGYRILKRIFGELGGGEQGDIRDLADEYGIEP